MFQMWQEVRPIMGNIHTPKPEYFKCGVVEFYVKKKQIYFKVSLWLIDGFTQYELLTGKYESKSQIENIIKQALQSFSSVGVIEN